MTTKYRITWQSKETGAKGYGQPFNNREMLEWSAADKNADPKSTCRYWVEAVEVDETAPKERAT
jgi:hypothetical protein